MVLLVFVGGDTYFPEPFPDGGPLVVKKRKTNKDKSLFILHFSQDFFDFF